MNGIWFTIDRYDRGCCGRKYARIIDALKDGSWSIWTEKKVRQMFNLGNGTMKDYERYVRNNNCEPVHEQGFWQLAEPLGSEWRAEAERYIEETIKKTNW